MATYMQAYKGRIAFNIKHLAQFLSGKSFELRTNAVGRGFPSRHLDALGAGMHIEVLANQVAPSCDVHLEYLNPRRTRGGDSESPETLRKGIGRIGLWRELYGITSPFA